MSQPLTNYYSTVTISVKIRKVADIRAARIAPHREWVRPNHLSAWSVCSMPDDLTARLAQFVQDLEWGADHRCPCCRASKREGHQTIVSTAGIWIENEPCPMSQMLDELKEAGWLPTPGG